MVVKPKREKVAILLRAGHNTNDIIAFAGTACSLVDTFKKILKTGVPLDKRSRKPKPPTVRTSFLTSKRALK